MNEAEGRGVARRIAARVEIRDIRLASSRIDSHNIPTGGVLTYSMDDSLQIGWEPGQQLFTLHCEYKVSVSELIVVEDQHADAPTEVESDVAGIAFSLAGLFELQMRDGDAPPTEEEITAYCATSGTFALYPFAREYVSDITSRLGLPSLTLPVKIVPIAQEESIL